MKKLGFAATFTTFEKLHLLTLPVLIPGKERKLT